MNSWVPLKELEQQPRLPVGTRMAADTNTTFGWKASAPPPVDRRGVLPDVSSGYHPAGSLGPGGAGPPPRSAKHQPAKLRATPLAVVLVVARSDVLHAIDFPCGSHFGEAQVVEAGAWPATAGRVSC